MPKSKLIVGGVAKKCHYINLDAEVSEWISLTAAKESRNLSAQVNLFLREKFEEAKRSRKRAR